MELKSAKMDDAEGAVRGSNRTFMELKSFHKAFFVLVSFVLIAPLWNWNPLGLITHQHQKGSNRTFMELKFRKSGAITLHSLCSNRTFMELK